MMAAPMRRGTSLVMLLRALASLLAAVGLVVGVPLALVLFVGWPLPSDIPSWEAFVDALEQQGITTEVLINVLAVVVWLAWAPLTWAILVEAAAATRGRAARRVFAWPGAQFMARRLVASAALLATSLSGLRGASASSEPLEPLVVVSLDEPGMVATEPAAPADLGIDGSVAVSVGEADPSSSAAEGEAPPPSDVQMPRFAAPGGVTAAPDAPSPSDAPRTGQTHAGAPEVVHVVEQGETFWGLGEQYLDSGLRWREIRDHNVGRAVAPGRVLGAGEDHLEIGWHIVVPDELVIGSSPGADVGTGTRPSGRDVVPAASPAAGPEEPAGPEAEAIGPEVTPAQTPVPAGGTQPAAPGPVTVEAGDHFWALAQQELEAAWGRPVNADEVGPYWHLLVASNLDRIRSGNPDLIFPGEQMVVPAAPPAPEMSAGSSDASGAEPGDAGQAEGGVTQPEPPAAEQPPAEETSPGEAETPAPDDAAGPAENEAGQPGQADEGAADEGAADEGSADEGSADEGATDAGEAPAGEAPADEAPSEEAPSEEEVPDSSESPDVGESPGSPGSPESSDPAAGSDGTAGENGAADSSRPGLPELDPTDEVEDEEDPGIPIVVPLGASAALAGLLLTALARRRRSRRRLLRPGMHIPPRAEEDARLERGFAVGAQDVHDTVYAASRAYGAALAANPNLPLVTGLFVSPSLDVLVQLEESAVPEIPFERGPASQRWELYLDELDLDPELGPGPELSHSVLDTPAVLGRSAEGEWVLVDLESLGALEIDGDPEVAAELLRSIVAELVLQRLPERMVDLTVVGLDGLPSDVLEQGVATFDHLNEDLVRRVERVAAETDAVQAHRGAVARAQGLPRDGLFITVVAGAGSAPPDPVLLERLAAAATPGGRGVAVVAVGELGPGATRVLVDQNGDAHIPHLGVTVTAARLATEDLGRVDRLLVDEPDVYPYPEGAPGSAGTVSDWSWTEEGAAPDDTWAGSWMAAFGSGAAGVGPVNGRGKPILDAEAHTGPGRTVPPGGAAGVPGTARGPEDHDADVWDEPRLAEVSEVPEDEWEVPDLLDAGLPEPGSPEAGAPADEWPEDELEPEEPAAGADLAGDEQAEPGWPLAADPEIGVADAGGPEVGVPEVGVADAGGPEAPEAEGGHPPAGEPPAGGPEAGGPEVAVGSEDLADVTASRRQLDAAQHGAPPAYGDAAHEDQPAAEHEMASDNGFYPYESPAWEYCVRIFADHVVETPDGDQISFRYGDNPDVPNKNTHRGPELIAYLALSGRAATAEEVRDHLWWDRPVALGTVNKLVYGTRKVLGGADLLSHAQEDPLGRYRLAHTVVTDIQLLTHALEYARSVANLRPEAAVEVLQAHLGGIEAVAFRSGYLGQGLMEWAAAYRVVDAVEQPIIEAALLVSRLSCERGREGYHDALWAIDQGLRACPYNESLVRVAMEIEALLGNTDAVNHRYLTLATRLARDELEPEPETSELRARLGGASRLRSAG